MNRNIIFLITIISFFITCCNKEDSPTSPAIQENSIEGLWQESFYGIPSFELVIKNNNIYEPDSIIRIANLRIDKDSFQVLVDQIYYLNDATLLENQKQLKGIYEIKNDTIITFVDSFNESEDYLYTLSENNLKLNYYIPLNDSIIVWIPPNTGLPWGRCMFKYGGELKK